MKRNLLTTAFLLIAAITFVACSSNDDEKKTTNDTLAMTTWVPEDLGNGTSMEVTFISETEGILFATTAIEGEDGTTTKAEGYVKFTYSVDKGTGRMSPVVGMTKIEGEWKLMDLPNVVSGISYNKEKEALTFTTGADTGASGDKNIVMKKKDYKAIEMPKATGSTDVTDGTPLTLDEILARRWTGFSVSFDEFPILAFIVVDVKALPNDNSKLHVRAGVLLVPSDSTPSREEDVTYKFENGVLTPNTQDLLVMEHFIKDDKGEYHAYGQCTWRRFCSWHLVIVSK